MIYYFLKLMVMWNLCRLQAGLGLHHRAAVALHHPAARLVQVLRRQARHLVRHHPARLPRLARHLQVVQVDRRRHRVVRRLHLVHLHRHQAARHQAVRHQVSHQAVHQYRHPPAHRRSHQDHHHLVQALCQVHQAHRVLLRVVQCHRRAQ